MIDRETIQSELRSFFPFPVALQPEDPRVTQKVFRYTSIKYYNWNLTITFSQSTLPEHLCNWRQSLSSSAQSSPCYAATAPSSVENRFPCSRAFNVGNRKKSPGCQVWTVRRMGQQLHSSPPQKIQCQMGGMGRGIVMVQQDAPSAALGRFSGNFWRTCGRATVVYHCAVTVLWCLSGIVATWPPAAKKMSTIFFPTLFAIFTLTGRSSLGNTQTDEWHFVSGSHW